MDETPKDGFMFSPVVLREEWGAEQPLWTDTPLEHPIPFIVMSYIKATNKNGPAENAKSHEIVRALQYTDMHKNGLTDIQCNFMIGDDGVVYEGRGWYTQPGNTSDYPGYEGKYIELAYYGDYNSDKARLATGHLLQVARRHNFIGKDIAFLREDKRRKPLLQ